jgi:hypothetical protein
MEALSSTTISGISRSDIIIVVITGSELPSSTLPEVALPELTLPEVTLLLSPYLKFWSYICILFKFYTDDFTCIIR